MGEGRGRSCVYVGGGGGGIGGNKEMRQSGNEGKILV